MSIWLIEAIVVIPFGIVCILLLLSEIATLRRLALNVCSVTVSVGRFTALSLSFLFAAFSCSVFGFQSYALYSLPSQPSPVGSADLLDRIRMKEWRAERNWWISLFACTLWLLVWRIQIWAKRQEKKNL